jgi:long-chain acyl-CoA synthetase
VNLVGDIAIHARDRPNSLALTFNRESLNWSELDVAMRGIARAIRAQAPQARTIALLLPHSPALALFFLAAARLGLEAQILDTQWPEDIRVSLLERLQPDLVVSTIENPARVGRAMCITSSRHNLHDLQAYFASEPTLEAWPSVDPSCSFYVGFTSGTTGLPKGYRRSHHSWVESFHAATHAFGIRHDDVVIAPGTLTHSLFLFALTHSMHVGAHCALSRSFRPDQTLSLIREKAGTTLFGVPVQLGLMGLLASGGFAATSVRRVISSGSKWRERDRAKLRRLFPEARFSEFYGTSETSFISVAHEEDDAPGSAVGRAFPGVEIVIREELGTPLAQGKTGRIFVRSTMTFDGYAATEELAAITSDGFVGTGDMGFLDEQGFLHLAGRERRMIVTSGKNLFPEEVERVLETFPGVQHAAVIALPDDKRGERTVAIVSGAAGAELNRSQLAAHARRHLPLFKLPRDYALATEWPLTRSGKTDFHMLENWWHAKGLERLP